MEKSPNNQQKVPFTGPSQVGQEEKIEENRLELKDSSGKTRCTVVTRFDYRISQRRGRLRSVEKLPQKHLVGILLENNGKSVDLLTLEGVPRKTVVLISDHICDYDFSSDEAFVPELKTIVDVYITLHELGHAAQYREGPYKKREDTTSPYTENTVAQFASSVVFLRELGVSLPIEEATTNELVQCSLEYNSAAKETRENNYGELEFRLRDLLKGFIDTRFPQLKDDIYPKVAKLALKADSYWRSMYNVFLETLNEHGLLTDELKIEIDNLLKKPRELFETRYPLFQASQLRVLNAEASFCKIIGNRFKIAKRVALDMPLVIREQDATLRTLRWVEKASQELNTSLDFLINTDEVNTVQKMRGATKESPPFDAFSNEQIQAILTICAKKELSAREVLEIGLISHGADDSIINHTIKTGNTIK